MTPADQTSGMEVISDRREFFQTALEEAWKELESLRSFQDQIVCFLLTAMGTLGFQKGLACITDESGNPLPPVIRGFDSDDESRLSEILPMIFEKAFRQNFPEGQPAGVSVQVSMEKTDISRLLPFETSFFIRWSTGDGASGAAALGESFSRADNPAAERNYLTHLAYALLFSRLRLKSSEARNEISLQLQAQNLALSQARQKARLESSLVDKQLFHLQSFYEIFSEIGGVKETKEIMDRFLLMTMGVFGAAQAYVLVFDRASVTAYLSQRGIPAEKRHEVPKEDLKPFIDQYFSAVSKENMAPMTARIASEPDLLESRLTPMEVRLGVLFLVDEDCGGMMGLGDRITETKFDESDRQLFLTLCNTFMVFLENARAFEKIETLNRDLMRRNLSLKKTIDTLSRYRRKIEVLEVAKDRIKGVIRKERERTLRVSILDLVLIVGLGSILGILFNMANPSGVSLIPAVLTRPPIPVIDVQTAKQKLDSRQAVIIDARPDVFFRLRHIAGAENLPPGLFEFVYMMKFSGLPQDQQVIVYGRNFSMLYDEEVAAFFMDKGHTNVSILAGGLEAWIRKGYPVQGDDTR
jgi:rhodanese-related sulfurtransferase